MTSSWSAWFAVATGAVSRISAIETEAHREDGSKYNGNRYHMALYPKSFNQCAAKAAARKIGVALGAGKSSTTLARSSIRIATLSGLTFAISVLAIRFAASFATLISTLSRSSKSTMKVWPR